MFVADFVAYLLASMLVKGSWKSASIWHSYWQGYSCTFVDHRSQYFWSGANIALHNEDIAVQSLLQICVASVDHSPKLARIAPIKDTAKVIVI